jgi:hypothetical protein
VLHLKINKVLCVSRCPSGQAPDRDHGCMLPPTIAVLHQHYVCGQGPQKAQTATTGVGSDFCRLCLMCCPCS